MIGSPPPSPPSAPLEDFIEGLLPAGEVHLLGGAPGAGKTALIAMLFAAILKGEPFLGYPIRKPAFLGFIAADRPWKSHQKWFAAVGLANIPHYSLVDDRSFKASRLRNKEDGVTILRECLDKLNPNLPPDSLIGVDPINLFMAGDLNNYRSCAAGLVELEQMCAEYARTLLGLAHGGKQKGDAREQYSRPQDRIAGSCAIAGHIGTAMYLACPSSEVKGIHHELTIQAHHARLLNIPLKRDDETGLFLPPTTVQPIRRATDPRRVLPFISTTGTSTGEIITAAGQEVGIAKATVKRDLEKLEAEGLVEHAEHGEWRKKE